MSIINFAGRLETGVLFAFACGRPVVRVSPRGQFRLRARYFLHAEKVPKDALGGKGLDDPPFSP